MSEHIPVFIYTFLACLSFCVIFKFHKIPHMIAAAAGGMLSWVIYVACGFLGNDLAQYLISTIIVSAYAEVMARVFKAPVTGFLTIGILPLVPGGGIYYTMEYCVSGQTSQFIETGIHTFAIEKSVMLGNYEFFYAAGLMRKLYNIEIRTDMEPEQILEAILQMQDNLTPQSEQEKYLIQIIKNYEPSADHDAQMDELFAWGEQEPDMWQVTTSFHPVIR